MRTRRLHPLALLGATLVLAVGVPTTLRPRPVAAGPATGETGSILVRAAGDRDPTTGEPAPLPGARLRAYADAGLTTPAGECTTDDTGTCTIAGLAPGPYWVAPAGDPPGGVFERLVTVDLALGGPQPYAEAVVVDEGSPTTRAFAFRRVNPPLPAACGVRVTLLFDVSGSISASEAAAMKSAATELVAALAGTPSAIGIVSFATDAPAAGNTDLAPTSVADAPGVTAVEQAIQALERPGGADRYTNWDAALRSVVGQADVVVLFTDGNPTVHGVPAVLPPVRTDLDQLDAGVVSANAVKAAGARVLAVGVGDLDALSAVNLALVSGPEEGGDYAITSFAEAHAVLRDLATRLCPRPEVPILVSAAPDPPHPVPRFTG